MRIRLIQSSIGGSGSQQFLASYVIDDTIAIDAGCIGFMSPVDEQRRIEHIFLSHTHIDHIASLPIFVDNVYAPGPDCVTIYGNSEVLECLRCDIFNDRVWPDMIQLSVVESPFMKLVEIEHGKPIEVNGLKITPIDLDHIVPTLGFVIESPNASVVFVSDTSPTQTIWDIANQTPNLKAAFLEASFPNSMDWLAEKAKHLTPEMFQDESQKLQRDATIIAVHIKPAYEEAIIAELEKLDMPNLRIGRPGQRYEF